VRIWLAAVLCSVVWLACGDDGEGGIDTADAGLDDDDRSSAGRGNRSAGAGGQGGTAGIQFGGSGGFGGQGVPVDPNACTACVCSTCAGVCLDCGLGCGCSVDSPTWPLPWEPPFADLGEDGWRESESPLCAAMDSVVALELWSDARGVFALVSGDGYTVEKASSAGGSGLEDDAGARAGDGYVLDRSARFARTKIWLNDGSSWTPWFDDQTVTGSFGLTGLSGSSLLLNLQAPAVANATLRACAIGMVGEGGELDCLDLDPVSDVFAVDATLAYAIMGGTRLLAYDGARWRSDSALIPYPVSAVWGDAESVVAVGRAGTVLRLEQGAWSLDDPGTLEHFTSVWGTARDDVWAGTSAGNVYHFDGAVWDHAGKLGGLTCLRELPVSGIWGAGDAVYFYTPAQLARWNGSEIESLANWSCATSSGQTLITDVWGDGPDQVFIAIVDTLRFPTGLCGPAYVVHYDGASFHRM
jgi:hypothetical protein